MISQICPHLSWRLMFLIFGSIGFLWVGTFVVSYKEIRVANEDDDFIIISPKVWARNAPLLSNLFNCSKISFLFKTNSRIKWIDYFKHPQLWSIYVAHFAMSWTSSIITTWLPYYLNRQLGVKTTALSFTAVPYIVNSLFGICKKTISLHETQSILFDKFFNVKQK